jgi:uncharacterized protein (TIGR02266 family)
MSVGGLFLETNNPLPLGEKLQLKFSLPESNHPVSCQGRVAWVTSSGSPGNVANPQGMGVEFLGLEDERQLKAFLKTVS